MVCEKKSPKRFAYFLLAVIILPIAMLFGCGETTSFSVQTYFSGSGTVSGTGTYSEGSTITLTAKTTSTTSGSFLGWVLDNSTLISNDETYSISNTHVMEKVASGASYDENQTYYVLDENNNYVNATISVFDPASTTYYIASSYITKSVLTFTSSSATQGNYTAVFDDGYVPYIKLESVEFSADLNISSFVLSEGSIVLTTVISTSDEAQFKEGFSSEALLSAISSNNSVLYLPYGTTKYAQVVMFLQSDTTSTSVTLRGALNFQTSTSYQTDSDGKLITDSDGNYVYNEIATTSGTYHVEYASEVYKIVFTFAYNDTNYTLTLTYKAL